MTDARIITREVLLELANDIYRTAFEAGYEAGQLMACLEKPEAAAELPLLKGLKLTVNPHPTDSITFPKPDLSTWSPPPTITSQGD